MGPAEIEAAARALAAEFGAGVAVTEGEALERRLSADRDGRPRRPPARRG